MAWKGNMKVTQRNKKSIQLSDKISMLAEKDAKIILEKALTYSLILYILANSKVQMPILMKDLSRIELESADIISSIITNKRTKTQLSKQTNGFLKGTISMILMMSSVKNHSKRTQPRNMLK